ncbi:two-component sensor histidine kinase [Deinococcus arenae]|uniref:histidine kinase n=1 Tax=Deinococcus arenae TaxID=1452751 RepID=A0A8H9GXJ5_9DEIO|nr:MULTISPECIES: ATP-binding protein [Deinococcus]GGM59830.1 two-component sensor histidine kinase [Deinococcus arenae]
MTGPAQRLSLRVKLTLGYALVFIVILLLGCAGIWLATERTVLKALDASLRNTIVIAQGSLEADSGPVRFTPELKPGGDVTVLLLRADGTVVSRVGRPGPEEPGAVRAGLRTVQGERSLTQPVNAGLYLRVSQPVAPTWEFLETLARILLAGSAGMVILACVAGYWLAHRALKPVDEVARTAHSIAERGDYAERVTPAPGHDEMARLTATVNRMLDRLSGTIEREKQFARIAAHELRTPLTALKGRLELTLEKPRSETEYVRALEGMAGRVDALGALTESLLALARTDAPVQLTRVNLGSAALSVSESWEDTARMHGRTLHLDVQESWVMAERDGVERVISNLLDNALKYGAAGPVYLRVSGVTLEVQNQGPGPRPDDWLQLQLPFERGAGEQAISGSGLGLALVAALARRWHAQVLPRWQGRTFTVLVAFPAEAGADGAAEVSGRSGPRWRLDSIEDSTAR